MVWGSAPRARAPPSHFGFAAQLDQRIGGTFMSSSKMILQLLDRLVVLIGRPRRRRSVVLSVLGVLDDSCAERPICKYLTIFDGNSARTGKCQRA